MFGLRTKISKILCNLPKVFLRKIILLESNPDYCDNTRGLYDRLIELGYNKKIKLVWFVTDKEKFKDIKVKNVKFVGENEKYKISYYRHFARYIIDSNKFINKLNKNQLRIHLTHGTALKDAKKYCSQIGNFDYVIQISDYFTEITKYLFETDSEKIVSAGFPRNDILLNKNTQVFYPEIKRKKTICWFPTYRNHKNSSTGKTSLPYGIPSVVTEDELIKLNDCLKKESVLLVIKLHPAEDASIIHKLNLDNVKLIEDSLFDKDHSTLYHYLSNVDAMITDYSSVYYDFLLTDRPIGLAISDINEYTKTTRLVFDKFEDNIVGDFIYNFDDLIKFIHNVSIGKDESFEARMEKKKLYHSYFDNHSADRVIELFEKCVGEK